MDSQLQELDLQGNEWLHMYAEFALYSKWFAYGVGSLLTCSFIVNIDGLLLFVITEFGFLVE